MSSLLKIMFLLVCCLASFRPVSAQTEESQPAPAGPVPSQIIGAKRVFICNSGEQTVFRLPKDAWYKGGPNRTYNEFYSLMKSWGRFDLVAAPADGDLVFEVGLTDRPEGQIALSQLKLVIRDARTGIPLWTIFQYIDWRGLAKNREKKYETAMRALLQDVKTLASGKPAPDESE